MDALLDRELVEDTLYVHSDVAKPWDAANNNLSTRLCKWLQSNLWDSTVES